MELLPERMASVVSNIGREPFGKAILGLFDQSWGISHCAAFERSDGVRPPRVLVASAVSDEDEMLSQQVTREWLKQDYTIDPWLSSVDDHACAVPALQFEDWRTKPCGADAEALIVRRYYEPLGVGEEATYSVRVAGKVICVSLFKPKGGQPFSAAQKESLARLSSLILGSAERHAQLLPARPSLASDETTTRQDPEWAQTRADKFAHLRSTLLMDERHLTIREAEVCAYIVMGYTAFAISLLLSISPNTVATHRRRAYLKLGLSSQTELFNVCLKYCV